MQRSQSITRKSASNLALAFVLLPREKREAMSALYAFCRQVDDIADEETAGVGERQQRLDEWRNDVQAACAGGKPRIDIISELQPFIQRYNLPFELFDELIRGVEMDLTLKEYPDWPSLDLYCYRVASVVGLLSIEVFGYTNPGCREYAIRLGKALQLTNILRDVRGDAERGRIYLPLTELERFKVRPEEVLQLEYSPRFAALARSVAQRARAFYGQARQALPAPDRRAMISAELMGSVYWRLLEKLEQSDFRVFEAAPTRLSQGQKLFLIARTWFRIWTGGFEPNYGNSRV